jgi:hypothetical protein
VYLEDGRHGGGQVVGFRRFRVEDVDREAPARDAKDGRVVEKGGELVGIQRG